MEVLLEIYKNFGLTFKHKVSAIACRILKDEMIEILKNSSHVLN